MEVAGDTVQSEAVLPLALADRILARARALDSRLSNRLSELEKASLIARPQKSRLLHLEHVRQEGVTAPSCATARARLTAAERLYGSSRAYASARGRAASARAGSSRPHSGDVRRNTPDEGASSQAQGKLSSQSSLQRLAGSPGSSSPPCNGLAKAAPPLSGTSRAVGSFLDTPARETSARSRTRRNSTPATFITPTALSLARAREGTEATGAADVSDDVREEVQAAMDRMVEFVSQHAAVEHSGGREGQESLESFQDHWWWEQCQQSGRRPSPGARDSTDWILEASTAPCSPAWFAVSSGSSLGPPWSPDSARPSTAGRPWSGGMACASPSARIAASFSSLTPSSPSSRRPWSGSRSLDSWGGLLGGLGAVETCVEHELDPHDGMGFVDERSDVERRLAARSTGAASTFPYPHPDLARMTGKGVATMIRRLCDLRVLEKETVSTEFKENVTRERKRDHKATKERAFERAHGLSPMRPERAEVVYISVTKVLQRCEEQRGIARAEAMRSQVVVDACAHPEVDEGSLENDNTAETPASES